MTLTEFKKSGPWIRIGDRSLAQRRFDAICKMPDGLRKLSLARDTYAAEVVSMYRMKRKQRVPEDQIKHFVQHLCTWLGRWEDYYEERTEVLHNEPTKAQVEEILKHSHRCVECNPSHDWECRSVHCAFVGLDLCACPGWIETEKRRLQYREVAK